MSIPQSPSPLSNIVTAKTYNAAWFSGSTKEAQITAAIVAAATDGALYVYVTANMMPYNAAAVTFNNAVKMICEGGDPSSTDVRAYGADSTGATDSTAAMQAAHNTGAIVYYISGTYSFTLVVAAFGGGIIGDSNGKTLLASTNITGANLFTFSGPSAGAPVTVANVPYFAKFKLTAPAGKLTGAGIQIAPSAGETAYSTFDSIHIQQCPIGIDFVAASRFKIIASNFVNFLVAGVQVANTNNQDSGDPNITGCLFENLGVTGGAAIIYKSSAGLKVIGCKLNVCTYGLWCQWTGTGSGDLIFAHNSIENCTISGVYMGRVGGSSFHNLQITGNEFSLCTNTIVCENNLMLTVAITTNIISMNVAGATTGIDITGATGVSIAANAFRGNGGTPTAIKLTSCDIVDVGVNNFIAMTTKVLYVTCTNLFDHNSYYGTVVCPNVTATTAFSLPLTLIGMYEVFCTLPNASGGAGAISATGRLICDGASLIFRGSDVTAGFALTAAGANVQFNQNSGSTQTLNWGYRRIA